MAVGFACPLRDDHHVMRGAQPLGPSQSQKITGRAAGSSSSARIAGVQAPPTVTLSATPFRSTVVMVTACAIGSSRYRAFRAAKAIFQTVAE